MEGQLKRLGVFGGTFNPIHIGHLVVAEEIREKFDLDRVLFIPSYLPPHKSVDIAPANHRLSMVRAAIKGNPFFGVSDIEIRRSEKSYTIETLKSLREQTEAEFFFLIGTEAFLQIHTWKDPEGLFEYTNFVIMERAGREITSEELDDYLKELEEVFPSLSFYHEGCLNGIHLFWAEGRGFRSKLYLTPVANIGISSTGIRKRVQKGKSIRYRVPEEVENYIKEYGLYR